MDNLTHIDSPETSDDTEAIPGESVSDDISFMLDPYTTGALQDTTVTEETSTICTENSKKLSKNKTVSNRRNSSPPRLQRKNWSEATTEQYGFENIVFEIDNRCDDQKIREPPRYCSLAHFVEGSDIERKSFKVYLFYIKSIFSHYILCDSVLNRH